VIVDATGLPIGTLGVAAIALIPCVGAVLAFARAWGPFGLEALRLRPPRLRAGLAWGALGLVAMVGVVAVMVLLALLGVRSSSSPYTVSGIGVGTLIAGVVLAPVAEETIVRGFCLRALQSTLPAWAAVIGSSLLFVFPHTLGGYDAAASLHVFLDGVIFAVVTLKTDSIWPAVVLHAVRNLVALA
jgi:membrane protease YdiL (CAAX protease family)